MGAVVSYTEAALVCQPMSNVYHNCGGPQRLMLHCQGGKHMGAIRAGRLAPTLGNLDNSRPKRQMAARGMCVHHVTTHWAGSLASLLQLFKAPKMPFESPSTGSGTTRPQRSPFTEPPKDKQCPVLCTQLMAAPKGPHCITENRTTVPASLSGHIVPVNHTALFLTCTNILLWASGQPAGGMQA